jgi:hypothetical protein
MGARARPLPPCRGRAGRGGAHRKRGLYDRLGDRHDAARSRLLRSPAPDVAALAVKLDLALDERTLEFFGDRAAMQAIKRDVRRLS